MLSAVLDLDTLLGQIVDAAVRLSNAEEGLLLLPDEEAAALYIRAVKGIDSETAKNFRIKTQDLARWQGVSVRSAGAGRRSGLAESQN